MLANHVAAVRRQFPLIALTVAAGALAAVGITFTRVPSYRATAAVALNASSPGGSAQTSSASGDVQSRIAATEAAVAHSAEVARIALGLAHVSSITPSQLLAHSTFSAQPASNIVLAQVTDSSPQRAMTLANAFAEAYISYSKTLNVERLNAAIAEVSDQINKLRRPGGASATGDLTALRARRNDLLASAAVQTGDAQLVSRANSVARANHSVGSVALVGAALGLLIGAGLGLVREALDTRIRNVPDIARVFDAPLLGRLRRPRKRGRLRRGRQERQQRRDEYRRVWSAIETASIVSGATGPVVAISAMPEEGKSTTIANLATMLSQSGRRVIVVDFDLRRPSLYRMLTVERSPGVVEVLLGEASLEQSVQAVDPWLVRGLWAEPRPQIRRSGASSPGGALHVLAAGGPPFPPETGRDDAVQALLSTISRAYDVVLVDTAPALIAAETIEIARCTDRNVVLARMGFVHTEPLHELGELLRLHETSLAGFIVTGAEGDVTYAADYSSYYRRSTGIID